MNVIGELRRRARQEAGLSAPGRGHEAPRVVGADDQPADQTDNHADGAAASDAQLDEHAGSDAHLDEHAESDAHLDEHAESDAQLDEHAGDEPHPTNEDPAHTTRRPYAGMASLTMQGATKRNRKEHGKRRQIASPFSISVIRHPSFAMILTIWGACVCGLIVMALSSVTIARISMFAGTGALGDLARLLFAGGAALAGAAGGFAFAHIARFVVRLRQARTHSVIAEVGRRVRPIDPGRELGSESLDAPLDAMPFAQAQEEAQDQVRDTKVAGEDEDTRSRDTEPGDLLDLDLAQEIGPDFADGADSLAAPGLQHEAQAQAQAQADISLQAEADSQEETGLLLAHQDEDAFVFDLSGFDETVTEDDADEYARDNEDRLSEEDAAQPESDSASDDNQATETETSIQPETAPALTGIEKLRATPTHELSLVQLVERFAAALHDAQSGEGREAAQPRTATGDELGAQSEQALANALKALSMFSQNGFAGENRGAGVDVAAGDDVSALNMTERDLREALARLQGLRGAA